MWVDNVYRINVLNGSHDILPFYDTKDSAVSGKSLLVEDVLVKTSLTKVLWNCFFFRFFFWRNKKVRVWVRNTRPQRIESCLYPGYPGHKSNY